MMEILTPTLFEAAGRIAIVGYGAVNALGTAETSFLTRTGRFDEALPEYQRLMGVEDGPGARDYIDRNIGIRTPRAEDMEEQFDPQRFLFQNPEKLTQDTMINGRLRPKGTVIHSEREGKLPVCHYGILPSGWNIYKEMGISGKPYPQFGRMHLMMVRMLAEAIISTGVSYETLVEGIKPEERKVAGGPGMAPGKFIRDGMVNPYLRRPIRKDQLAWYLADNAAFWLAKLLNARHASTRIGACNTGICNLEDLVAAMRTGQIRFGAAATFESAINEPSIIGFSKQMALANDRSVALLNDHPSLVSRPGLANRSGFVMGEGGGILLLMNMKDAIQKGLIIYGEVLAANTALGPLMSLDPAAPTDGVILAMARGVMEAAKIDGVTPQQFIQTLDFINGHGTSTPAGDINGMACYDALLKRFGRDPRRPVAIVYAKGGPRLDSIPSARQVGGNGTGHLLGGAALAAAVENVAIHEEGILPASVSSLNEVDPLILVGGKVKEKEYKPVRHLIYTTAPTIADAEVGAAEAEGFGDSNGGHWSRRYRAERYRGGRDIVGAQDEKRAQRDEWRAAVRAGSKKVGEVLPELKTVK